MANRNVEPRVLVNYYLRKGWYDHVKQLHASRFETFGTDNVLAFWRAISLVLEGSYPAAIRELVSLKSRREVESPCLQALVYAHSQCKHVDTDEVSQLELQVCIAEENASVESLLLSATMYWHLRQPAKAKKILDQIGQASKSSGSKSSDLTPRVALLRGWIDITLDPKTKKDIDCRNGAIHLFEAAQGFKDAELLLGVAKYYEAKKSYSKSLEYLDQLIVKYPWFSQGVSEKALILVKMNQWDECLDSVERALDANAHDIDALHLRTFLLLSREGKRQEAISKIRNLEEALDHTESENAQLYYELSKSIVRISDGDETILQMTLSLLDGALRLHPESSVYQAERGYQMSVRQDYSIALECYKDALKLDESNEAALHGLIYCQLQLAQTDDAAQQLEFLSVIQESIGNNPGFIYLQAMLTWAQHQDRSNQVKQLQRAVQLHMEQLKDAVQYGDLSAHELMTLLNPLFLVEIASEFLRSDTTMTKSLSKGRGQEALSHEESHDLATAIAAKGIGILEKLVHRSPGLLRAQSLLATAYFTASKLDDAYRICNHIIKLNPEHSVSHLLQARISMEREHYRAAEASLDQALSHDFSVRQTLGYSSIHAKIQENRGDVGDALKTLQQAMKTIKSQDSRNKSGSKVSRELLYDKASVYIQLAQALAQLNNVPEAVDVVREALQVFRGTGEEVRVVLANSELALKRGDHESAIALLSNVPPSSPAFTKAQMAKADIYLHYRKDKVRFAKCYQELVARRPAHATYVSLAEAYLRIQELDQAIGSFKEAMKLKPDDSTLAGRIGRVLTAKHDYLKAVDYYESALKHEPRNLSLRTDLTDLYIKLGHFDQAFATVQQVPPFDGPIESEELEDIVKYTELQLTLPEIHVGRNNQDLAVQALLKAQSLQKMVLDRLQDEQPDVLQRQKKSMAQTSYQVAEIYAKRLPKSNDDLEQIHKYCTMALRLDETHENALLQLARVGMLRGNLDQCQTHCQTLLRLQPSSEPTALLLSDVLVQKEETDAAIGALQRLLESQPANFQALRRLIHLARRAGKLDLAQKSLTLAERSGVRAAHAPGFYFCKGLCYRYTNKVREAIESFNCARKDTEYGESALIHMIELYLNPDQDFSFESDGGDAAEPLTREQAENLRIANTLLDELPIHSEKKSATSYQNVELRVLEAYAVLAARSKSMVDKSIQLFLEMLETEGKDYIPAIVGLSVAYIAAKQQPKARNQLKRVVKMNYDARYAEDLERAYLLLADIYIGKSKFDMAQELCKKALVHNKSSGKAWELLGLVMEKTQSFVDAADCYHEAWRCEHEASAPVGFKLAFNYLKARRFVAAIDVCNHVLSLYPNYPRIQTDILDKAVAGFRP